MPNGPRTTLRFDSAETTFAQDLAAMSIRSEGSDSRGRRRGWLRIAGAPAKRYQAVHTGH
jgi:hypothetical protein